MEGKTHNENQASARIEKLVEENIDLVFLLARKFHSLDFSDAESDANFALFKAAKKFVEKDLPGNFRSYAYTTILNALLDLAKAETKRKKLVSVRSVECTYIWPDIQLDFSEALDFLASLDDSEDQSFMAFLIYNALNGGACSQIEVAEEWSKFSNRKYPVYSQGKISRKIALLRAKYLSRK